MAKLIPSPSVPSPTQERARRDRRLLVVSLSVLAGFLLTVVWSASFVDRTIGDGIANTLLGHDAKETPIAGVVAGTAFALVTGLAGTFTACNIAVFGALAPLAAESTSRRERWASILRPFAWLGVGMVAVAAIYGFLVGLVGESMPQFSTAAGGASTGISPRLVQAMVTFGVIGIAFIYLGLAALGLVKDVFAGISARFPNFRMLLLGVLIGGFLIGRPFALYRILFHDIAERSNPFYGALAFTLQSLGNVLIMVALAALVVLVMGERLRGWLTANPARAGLVTGATLLTVGVFTLLYWDLRILHRVGYLWYPTAPWS